MDGLAFDGLLSPEGFLDASTGFGGKDFGRQRHFVQPTDLARLPVEGQALHPERVAHHLHHKTTYLAARPHFFGWTSREFLVASFHLGDAAGWRKDWSNVQPSNYAEEERVQ